MRARFKTQLDEFLARRRNNRSGGFDPSTYKRNGFYSKKAVALFNSIANDDLDGSTREEVVRAFIVESQLKDDSRSSRQRRSSKDGAMMFPFWVEDDDLVEPGYSFEGSTTELATYKFSAQTHEESSIRYPISTELPHVVLPIGKSGDATVEALLDTGGACTMGDIEYWTEVSKRKPELISHFEELSSHQEKPISIGGVGAGKVQITHVMGLWLPWMVGTQETKLVIGLGTNMPMTLLIGLPFQIGTQCSIDIGNLKCYSATFNTTWKLVMKRPIRKDIRMLDAAMSSQKRHVFNSNPSSEVSPSPKKKKIRWDIAGPLTDE